VASIRSSVVFPAPFGPSTARISPGRQTKETRSTARIAPRFLSVNVLHSSWASIKAVLLALYNGGGLRFVSVPARRL
jgi:hypothetical protein